MKTPVVLALCLAAGACGTTPVRPPPACFHRAEAVEKEVGYCQALRAGNRLYVSGTAGRGEMRPAVQSVYE
ncbi:MAG: hypothetical protein JSR54_09220, partial [Proteobacteria bacterium]|nr:hypothetical protein [Pseudomonadota bacterium]